MNLTQIKTLDGLKKFVKENEFLYDGDGNRYLSRDLYFTVSSDNESFIAIYWGEKLPLSGLFDEKSYLKCKKEKEKAEKDLYSVFSEI